MDDPCRGSGRTGLPAHRCDLPGVTMSGLLPLRPGSIREVGDEAAGGGPERNDNSRSQCTDCVRMVHVLKTINGLILDAVRRLKSAMARRGKAGRRKKRG